MIRPSTITSSAAVYGLPTDRDGTIVAPFDSTCHRVVSCPPTASRNPGADSAYAATVFPAIGLTPSTRAHASTETPWHSPHTYLSWATNSLTSRLAAAST